MTGSYAYKLVTGEAGKALNLVPEPHGNHGSIMAAWIHCNDCFPYSFLISSAKASSLNAQASTNFAARSGARSTFIGMRIAPFSSIIKIGLEFFGVKTSTVSDALLFTST